MNPKERTSGNGAVALLFQITRRRPALLPLVAGMLFLAGCTTPSGTGKREADFTHYDEPLYEQMTDRIKARVMARIGRGEEHA